MITLIVKLDLHTKDVFKCINATEIARDKALNLERLCEGFTINSDPNNQNGLILIETFYDQAALDYHKTTPHYLEWKEKVKSCLKNPTEVTRYDSI